MLTPARSALSLAGSESHLTDVVKRENARNTKRPAPQPQRRSTDEGCSTADGGARRVRIRMVYDDDEVL